MVELLLYLHVKTGNALKVSRDGDESKAGWVSRCTFKELGNGRARVIMKRDQAEFLFGKPLPLYDGKAA